MLHRSNLRETVLFQPARLGANELIVISGYASPSMASWHITELRGIISTKIDIKVVVGMCISDGLTFSTHNGFKNMMTEYNSGLTTFTCQYITEGAPVHSKLYLWEKDAEPICAFIGSANYTQTAFSNLRNELITECDPREALEYYNFLEPHSTFCNHAEIENSIVLKPTSSVLTSEQTNAVSIQGTGIDKVHLSLLSQNGETGFGSGINWGHRRDGTKREPNQAYIPLPSSIARTGFFPLDRKHFSVITDDGKQIILRVEQQNDKAITTPLNNSLIGEYLRGRLGVTNGAFVTKEDLQRYGRTDITFYKLDDEQFFMDFSV